MQRRTSSARSAPYASMRHHAISNPTVGRRSRPVTSSNRSENRGSSSAKPVARMSSSSSQLSPARCNVRSGNFSPAAHSHVSNAARQFAADGSAGSSRRAEYRRRSPRGRDAPRSPRRDCRRRRPRSDVRSFQIGRAENVVMGFAPRPRTGLRARGRSWKTARSCGLLEMEGDRAAGGRGFQPGSRSNPAIRNAIGNVESDNRTSILVDPQSIVARWQHNRIACSSAVPSPRARASRACR